MRPLSYSSISTYEQCPLLYKLKYIEGRREEKKFYLSWGKSLHDALEFLYGVKVPPAPSMDDVLACYREKWRDGGYETAEQEKNYFAEGERILTDYYLANIENWRLPAAVERQFNLEIDGVKLTGFFDRVDKLDNGTLAIVDYKSSQRLFDKDYLAGDLQLTLYQLAAEMLWDLPVSKLSLYHLRSNTACCTGPRSADQLDEARNLIARVAAKIERGCFEPVENHYCPCDFPERCPYYGHLYKIDRSQTFPSGYPEELTPALKQAQAELAFGAVLKDIDIKQVVEEYAERKADEKEAEARVKELAEIIKAFSASEQVKRVYGLEHAVTLSESGKATFDGERVRKILEPVGLWEKVLGFDQKALRSLIDEGGLAADTKKALAEAETVTSVPRLTVKKLLEEELAD